MGTTGDPVGHGPYPLKKQIFPPKKITFGDGQKFRVLDPPMFPTLSRTTNPW